MRLGALSPLTISLVSFQPGALTGFISRPSELDRTEIVASLDETSPHAISQTEPDVLDAGVGADDLAVKGGFAPGA